MQMACCPFKAAVALVLMVLWDLLALDSSSVLMVPSRPVSKAGMDKWGVTEERATHHPPSPDGATQVVAKPHGTVPIQSTDDLHTFI